MIPDSALDDRLFFGGTSGSGKTYTATECVERLLAKRRRVGVVDPLGVWWGLRLARDGKAESGLDVVIFGGPRGDLPLNQYAGALIGETTAGMKESFILDLSEIGSKAEERRFMLAFLTAFYRHATREPVHLVFDEADMFAPQKLLDKEGDAAKLLGMMETVVRRGRSRGFIPWLISQRPAVISKDVLSQVDGLIALKLTSSQDRDAIGAWVEGQADVGEWKKLYVMLPTMKTGQGVVWIPGRGIMESGQFPLKSTFDSSRTPTRGERVKAVASLKPLDVGALKDRLGTIEAEVKANDPKVLKAKIAELEKRKPVASVEELEEAERRGADRTKVLAEELAAERITTAFGAIREVIGKLDVELKRIELASCQEIAVDAVTPIDRQSRPGNIPAAIERLIPAKPPRAPDDFAVEKEFRREVSAKRPPVERILDAIAWWEALGVPQPSAVQASFVAGYSAKSSTWSTYVSRARADELIIASSGRMMLTAKGRHLARATADQPSGIVLREMVLAKIDEPLRRILTPILDAHSDSVLPEVVARVSGYSVTSSTFSTYLSRLRSLGLIDRGGQHLRAQDWLFP